MATLAIRHSSNIKHLTLKDFLYLCIMPASGRSSLKMSLKGKIDLLCFGSFLMLLQNGADRIREMPSSRAGDSLLVQSC